MPTQNTKNDIASQLIGRGARMLIQANGREKAVELLIDLIEEISEDRK